MVLVKDKLAQALDTLRSGLYVVTSVKDGEAAGCTVVWVSRVSFSPPLLAVTLSPARHTCQAIEASRVFCINVLSENQQDLARRFGFNTGPESRKFENLAFHEGEGGVPVLDSVAAHFVCKVSQIYSVGDHKLIIGEVAEASLDSAERPAVYSAESFYSENEQVAGASSS
jgi:flavin reductase (DIM6/NTAB) family NADH-FMN oxidoreductase RutF